MFWTISPLLAARSRSPRRPSTFPFPSSPPRVPCVSYFFFLVRDALGASVVRATCVVASDLKAVKNDTKQKRSARDYARGWPSPILPPPVYRLIVSAADMTVRDKAAVEVGRSESLEKARKLRDTADRVRVSSTCDYVTIAVVFRGKSERRRCSMPAAIIANLQRARRSSLQLVVARCSSRV